MTVRKLQLTVHPKDRIREEHTQLLCIGSIHRERPPAQPQDNQQRLSPEFLPLPPNWSPCFLLALLYYPHSNQDDSFKTSVTSCHFSSAASHHLQAQCNLAQISSELTSHPIPLPHHMPAAPAPWLPDVSLSIQACSHLIHTKTYVLSKPLPLHSSSDSYNILTKARLPFPLFSPLKKKNIEVFVFFFFLKSCPLVI